MMPRKIQIPMVPSPPVRSRDAYYSLGGRRPGTALLRAPEAEREREPRRKHERQQRERRADAEARDQLAGREELHGYGEHADGEIDRREDAGAYRGVIGRRRDDRRLLEIQEGRRDRQQRDP